MVDSKVLSKSVHSLTICNSWVALVPLLRVCGGKIHTFAQELMQKRPSPDWVSAVWDAFSCGSCCFHPACVKVRTGLQPSKKQVEYSGCLGILCCLFAWVSTILVSSQMTWGVESMNKPEFISLFHRKPGLSERKTVPFTVVLFVGRYRKKNLPNARSWGASPGFVSWLYYHCVMLANSPGFLLWVFHI